MTLTFYFSIALVVSMIAWTYSFWAYFESQKPGGEPEDEPVRVVLDVDGSKLRAVDTLSFDLLFGFFAGLFWIVVVPFAAAMSICWGIARGFSKMFDKKKG